MSPILQVENLTKSFGDLVLFENISFGLVEGQRVGLIAKNGSGKSTLLNILSGKEGYDEGKISFRRDLRVGYLEQSPSYPEELTVLEACFHHGNTCFATDIFFYNSLYANPGTFVHTTDFDFSI